MTGILLIQLGTPDRPDHWALRRYLRQFLSDRRVIEVPRAIWYVILYVFVLPLRPFFSAAKYRRIWDAETGSPLRYNTRRQAEFLQEQFPHLAVTFGMQYGYPSVESAVKTLIHEKGVDRLVVMPMYPQYSGTTTASATDALFRALMKERVVPAIHVVPPYYNHPAYIDAMATVIEEDLAALDWKPEKIVFSFHGIPIKYCKRGDVYATHVVRTIRELAPRLNLKRDDWVQTYQSLFGRDAWLRPYTDDVLAKLGKQGVKRVFVALPGFTADCLETVDEIGHESLEAFHEAGGEQLRACKCLNDHPAWIAAMKQIILDEAGPWVAPPESGEANAIRESLETVAG